MIGFYAVHMKKTTKLFVAGVVITALAVTVGPWTYINLIKDDAPDALTINDSTDTSSPTSSVEALTDATGSWKILTPSDSVVGYRVKEILFGQATEGVGRTRDVTGNLTIADNAVTAADFTVQMGTIMSDAEKRDNQFNNRIMDVSTYPTATFTLTAPIALPANSLSGEVITATAIGDLTLRGVTKSVTFPIEAQVTGQTFTVVGNITIVFNEWNIPEPGIPGITVDPDGLLEFSLQFSRNN